MRQTPNRWTAWMKPDVVWPLLLLGGASLRLREYLLGASLSGDEASLALNLVDRTFSGLTQPLAYEQGAPIAYLFIEKLSIFVLGKSEFVFRLFPFLSGVAALYFIYRVAREKFGTAGQFAVFGFAISWSLILYGSYLKQYSSDVLSALLLVYLSGRCLDAKARPRDFLWLGAAGVITIWFSHPSVFVLAGIGLVLVSIEAYRKDRARLLWCVGLGTAWAISWGTNYILFLRQLTSDAYLESYWHYAFMPVPPWSHPRWFLDTYQALLLVSLGRSDAVFASTCLLLIAIGSVSLLVRDRALGMITLLPFVMALVASALHKYPLDERFLLFLVPLVLLLMAEGFGRIYDLTARKANKVLAVTLCAVIFIAVFRHPVANAYRNFITPPTPWDLRPVLEKVAKNWSPNDVVYISGGAQASSYYAEYFGLEAGTLVIRNEHRVVSLWHFEQDLQKWAGRDGVWIVFAHFEPRNATYVRYVRSLQRAGKVQETVLGSDARAYLLSLRPK